MLGVHYILILLSAGVVTLASEPRRNSKDVLTVENCGKSKFLPEGKDRIVGGGYVKHGMYPWMVSLYEQTSTFNHACGATILNEHWIITAAHCIDFPQDPWRYEVFLGLYKLNEEDGPTVKHYTISEVYVHENYDKRTNANDIALLKTKFPIDFAGSGGYINGVCLPANNEDPKGEGVVTGWGHEQFWGTNSNTLKHVAIPFADREICNKAYGGKILEMMICAGSDYKDTCQNDSGGPLIQIDSKGTATLFGVTSFGRGCGSPGYPGVYTKVSHFRDWMTNIIKP